MKKVTRNRVQVAVVCLGLFGVTASASAHHCPGRPTLKVGTHSLNLNETRSVCVRRNGVFKIKLKEKSGYTLDFADVSVKAKTGSTHTITKLSVSVQGVMKVQVGNFQVGTEPSYEIHVDGVGTLDPRVRIIPSFSSFNPIYDAITDYLLDQHDLTLSALTEIDEYLLEHHGTGIPDILDTIKRAEVGE